jgi:deazaflavin-dependent oxidoreductase (nitroreductase family)
VANKVTDVAKPMNRPANIPAWRRPIDALASSKPVARFLSVISPVIDRWLMRRTRGKFALTLGMPTLLLTTTGRKTGEPREAPLLYLDYDDQYVVIGTRFGNTSHPAWYQNLLASPQAVILLDGNRIEVTMREARDDEREILWERATRLYSGYEKYKSRVGERRIPILVLSPVDDQSIPSS